MVRVLLTHQDIIVNSRDKSGQTALYIMAREGHVNVVSELL